MSDTHGMQAPKHRSHSQVSSWLECGEKYRLERIVQIDETPAWWFVGGTAFHQTIEEFELARFAGTELNRVELRELWELKFAEEVERRQKVEPDTSLWRAGGRRSAQWPEKENGAWWMQNGPMLVDNYRSFSVNTGLQMWATPDGTPGIELKFEHVFEGVTVKGAIDQVVWHNGRLTVRDLKTGKEPKNPLQLELYAHVLQDMFPDAPFVAADYYLAKAASTSVPHIIDKSRRHRLALMYQMADDGISRNFFPPNPSAWCGSCGVREFCRLFGSNTTFDDVATSAPKPE